jgi:hypothetical protein
MNKFFSIIVAILLAMSCSNNKGNSDLLVIPVDIDTANPAPLSEIAEEINAVELELTDESLLSKVQQVLLSDEFIIVLNNNRGDYKILLFDNKGKFIRQIASKGQGPGEYTGIIKNIALDSNNKRLFINTRTKIICYGLEGNFIKESSLSQFTNITLLNLNYLNDGLCLLAEHIGEKDEKGKYNHSVLYRLNDEFQKKDSCTVRKVYFERPGTFQHPYEDFITYHHSGVYLYYSDLYFDQQNPAEEVLRDTLYQLKDKQLVPELKLKFKNEGITGGKKSIQLFNIYRSSRYVFAIYAGTDNNYCHFCFDTKTGKSYNMKDGYKDDVNNISEKTNIRPLCSDTEKFYYLYTNMDNAVDLEEPNPTLYIGTLKK